MQDRSREPGQVKTGRNHIQATPELETIESPGRCKPEAPVNAHELAGPVLEAGCRKAPVKRVVTRVSSPLEVEEIFYFPDSGNEGAKSTAGSSETAVSASRSHRGCATPEPWAMSPRWTPIPSAAA